MDKAQRLFLILKTIQSQPGITAPELAKIVKTSNRTIYRYIRLLDECGIQITVMGNKGYYLINPFVHSKTKLKTEEYLAISLLPQLMTQSKIKGQLFQQSFQSAMNKIREHVIINENLFELTKRIRIGTQMNEQQEQLLARTIEGIVQSKTLACEYYTMYRDELNTRKIDPYYLVPREGNLYLVGYCHTRQEIRTFRLSRFQSIALTKEKFTMRADFDIDTYLDKRWGIKGGEKEVTFKVRFSPKIARYILEYRYETQPEFAHQKDGSLLLTVTTKGVDAFLRWLRHYGIEAEILEPVEYRKKMLEELQKMVEMYERNI